MTWVSPTNFVDDDSVWNSETNAYDGNVETDADTRISPNSWSSYLELTHAALNCDKIRFYATYYSGFVDQISIDVYYEGGWHNIYEGGYATEEWVEKTIPAGTKLVTAAQVKFYNDHYLQQDAALFEFEFNEVVVAVGRSFGIIFG